MNFLDRIDMLMEQKCINKNQLANLTGIPVSTIYGWYKKGYGSITLPTLLKLSEFFCCTMEFLVNGDIEASSPSLAALDVAHNFDRLDDHGKQVISAIMELELKRINDVSYAAEVERFNSIADEEDFIESNAL